MHETAALRFTYFFWRKPDGTPSYPAKISGRLSRSRKAGLDLDLRQKEHRSPNLLPIKQVAQERGYYPSATETELNEKVEKPANIVLKKLRQGLSLGVADRSPLAYYIATMLTRGPKNRELARSIAPSAIKDVTAKIKAGFQAEEALGNMSAEQVTATFAELEAIKEKHTARFPPPVIDSIENPWPTKKMLDCVLNMTWRFCSASGPSFFLSSESPTSFFSEFGIGTKESELGLLPRENGVAYFVRMSDWALRSFKAVLAC